jgi:hypothetical protein
VISRGPAASLTSAHDRESEADRADLAFRIMASKRREPAEGPGGLPALDEALAAIEAPET